MLTRNYLPLPRFRAGGGDPMATGLRQSLAELPEMNPGPVCRVTLDGTIELVNRAARETFGDEELVGKCWFDVTPAATKDVWARLLETGQAIQYEDDVRDRCFVFTLAHRLGGEHVFVYGVDVTPLKLAERKLAEQAAELREMALFPERNPGPVCRLDGSGVILLANRAARQLFRDEALIGRSWLDICPGATQEFWDRVLAATDTVVLEARVEPCDLVFTHTPPTDGGQVFVYGADVNVQKEAERALRQTEKMATLGTLAAGVAHELNNPAAAVQRATDHLRDEFRRLQAAQLALGSLSLSPAERETLAGLDREAGSRAESVRDLGSLARSDTEEAVEEWLEAQDVSEPWDLASTVVDMGYDGDGLTRLLEGLPSENLEPVLRWLVASYQVYRLLHETHHGAARLSEIVTALKEYSYVGQAPVQAVDVNEGIRNTLIILRSKLKQSVAVVQELADDLPVIQAHGGDLNQVWTNLIDNAVAALNGEGRITLRSTRRDGFVVVEVEDDGPGIPMEHQSRVFDAFFTTKAPGQGTGLGLHTCYNIVVKKHGGTIDVDSEPGRTRFTVRLPTGSRARPTSE